jgi:hypothetical protein
VLHTAEWNQIDDYGVRAVYDSLFLFRVSDKLGFTDQSGFQSFELFPTFYRDPKVNIEGSPPWPPTKDVAQHDLARCRTCEKVLCVTLAGDLVNSPYDVQYRRINIVVLDF